MRLPRWLKRRKQLLAELAEQQQAGYRLYFMTLMARATTEYMEHELEQALHELRQERAKRVALQELLDKTMDDLDER